MQKTIVYAVSLAAVLSLALLAGCGGSGGSSSPVKASSSQQTDTGSSTFIEGPDNGHAFNLTVAASENGGTSATIGGTVVTPLTGTLVITLSNPVSQFIHPPHKTIPLSGSLELTNGGLAQPSDYQLTGTDPSSPATTYTVTGFAAPEVPFSLELGHAVVTSSTGDSGTVSLQ